MKICDAATREPVVLYETPDLDEEGEGVTVYLMKGNILRIASEYDAGICAFDSDMPVSNCPYCGKSLHKVE